jgi:radical SAM family RiPP maturation amino acid epimerase
MTHAENYQKIFDSRSAEEMQALAQIKRFMENVVGDEKFRQQLAENIDDPRSVAQARGIDLDPRLMRPLYQHGFTHLRFEDGEEKYPLAMMWDRYIGEMLAHRDSLKEHGSTAEIDPRFEKWRQRQMRRVNSECGSSGAGITHPIVAYELSEGCSVGCWFCGISAEKFQGHWPYTDENRDLWRGVLASMERRFGTAAQTGFCYWATDPMDNPDYPRFIEDYYHINGYLPQTTTAAPLKDVKLTREVLDIFWKYRSIVNRFSVLSTKLMHRIHEEFTADELMPVELVLQNKEALMSKAKAGRARERQKRLRDAGKDDRISIQDSDHTTIACVSGFLINMVVGSLQLVTPTRPSERWPKGYLVLNEYRFDSIESFDSAMDALLANDIRVDLEGSDRALLREDLSFESIEGGFALSSTTGRVTCNKLPFSDELGRLVVSGEATFGSLLRELVSGGADVLMVNKALQELYANGVFQEFIAEAQAAASLSRAATARPLA